MFRTGCFSKVDKKFTHRKGSVHAGVCFYLVVPWYMLNLLGHTFCKKSISLLFIIIILKLYNLICYSLASLIEKHSFLLLIKKQQNLFLFFFLFFFLPSYLCILYFLKLIITRRTEIIPIKKTTTFS